jgi:hypothetical protein
MIEGHRVDVHKDDELANIIFLIIVALCCGIKVGKVEKYSEKPNLTFNGQ